MTGGLLRYSIASSEFRREVLLATLLLMESCVITAAFIPLNQSTSAHAPLPGVLAIAGLMAIAHLLTRYVTGTELPLSGQRALIVGAIVACVGILTRFHVHSYIPLGSGRWLGQVGSEWLGVFSGLTNAPVATAIVLICWWRGMHLAYRELTLQSVSLSFRLDILWLIGIGLLWEASRSAEIGLLVYGFFFFAILSMGLARVDEISIQKEGVAQPFGIGWLTIMLGAGLAVVGLGWIVAQVYSPAGFRALGEWLSPAFRVAERAIYAVFMFLGRLLEPLLEFLVRIMEALLNAVFRNVQEVSPQDFSLGFPTPEPTQTAEGGFPWGAVLKWAVIAGILLVALLGLAFSLRKLLPRSDADRDSAQRSLLGISEWGEELLDNLRAGANRLADVMATLTQHGLGIELYAVLSIRSIYASMARTAGRRGYARHQAVTPYEYLSALAQAFPSAAAVDLSRITDAYVGVHYGEIPATLHEVQEIRQCWDRVRTSASEADVLSINPDGS